MTVTTHTSDLLHDTHTHSLSAGLLDGEKMGEKGGGEKIGEEKPVLMPLLSLLITVSHTTLSHTPTLYIPLTHTHSFQEWYANIERPAHLS